MALSGTTVSGIPGFGGQLHSPGSAGYDEARAVFNAMIDRRPKVVAVCGSVADVVAAVNFARDEDLPLSVYGGGHAVTGAAVCDDGVCVDLRGMKGIEVDTVARTARAEAGLNWGEFDAATQEHGLAVTGGRVPDTGIAGLALGSGSGWLERKFGFTCDNLLAAEVVTADGQVVTASATENADLFWGLRGGGGNFGIVTSFLLQLHPVGPIVLGGLLVWPAPMANDVVRFWRDFMLTAPDEVGSALAFITAPPADFVPEPVRGTPVLGMVLCYAGDVAEGEGVVRPLREFGPPPLDLLGPMPYTAVQDLISEANPHGPAQLLVGRLPRGAARRSDRHARRDRDRVGVTPHADPARGRRWCHRPCARGCHRVRCAHRAVQRALPLDVGGPGRRRRQHRVHQEDRGRDEAVDERAGVPQLHR